MFEKQTEEESAKRERKARAEAALREFHATRKAQKELRATNNVEAEK